MRKVTIGKKLNRVEIIVWNAFRHTIVTNLHSQFCDTMAIVNNDDLSDAACCRLRVLHTPCAFCAMIDVLEKNGAHLKPFAPRRSIGNEARSEWSNLRSIRLSDIQCLDHYSGVCAHYVSFSFAVDLSSSNIP